MSEMLAWHDPRQALIDQAREKELQATLVADWGEQKLLRQEARDLRLQAGVIDA